MDDGSGAGMAGMGMGMDGTADAMGQLSLEQQAANQAAAEQLMAGGDGADFFEQSPQAEGEREGGHGVLCWLLLAAGSVATISPPRPCMLTIASLLPSCHQPRTLAADNGESFFDNLEQSAASPADGAAPSPKTGAGGVPRERARACLLLVCSPACHPAHASASPTPSPHRPSSLPSFSRAAPASPRAPVIDGPPGEGEADLQKLLFVGNFAAAVDTAIQARRRAALACCLFPTSACPRNQPAVGAVSHQPPPAPCLPPHLATLLDCSTSGTRMRWSLRPWWAATRGTPLARRT